MRLWVFDYDGTLSNLVADRRAAAILPESQVLLRELANRKDATVAILSSRTLDDLKLRVVGKGIYLGGSSGLYWQSPQEQLFITNELAAERAARQRTALIPLLNELLRPYDVDLEDKFAALTVHYRNLNVDMHADLIRLLHTFCKAQNLHFYEGPFALEIRLDESIKKVEGLRSLFDLLPGDYCARNTTYAGDDENDADAMGWLLAQGGRAFIVGERIRVTGARNVESPLDLVGIIRKELK